MTSSVPDATPVVSPPASDSAPFPLGSVQAVASLSWRLCLREDPVGLLLIPFVIFFPVYAFLTLLGEALVHVTDLSGETALFGAILGALPLVIFARVFGESWLLVRADSDARGPRVPLVETFTHALARSWHLVVVMIAVYVLFQIGFFLLVLPGLVVWIACSFANQAAVLGPGRLFASLRMSRDLLEHNVTAWLGMVAYWIVLFLGLGMLVGIVRQSVVAVVGEPLGFLVDLALGIPLQLALLVFTTCWTLFYRELEARRRRQARPTESLAARPPAHPRPDWTARAG